MKKVYSILLLGAILVFSTATYAQKVKVLSGKVDVLKGADKINLEYDYSNMG